MRTTLESGTMSRSWPNSKEWPLMGRNRRLKESGSKLLEAMSVIRCQE